MAEQQKTMDEALEALAKKHEQGGEEEPPGEAPPEDGAEAQAEEAAPADGPPEEGADTAMPDDGTAAGVEATNGAAKAPAVAPAAKKEAPRVGAGGTPRTWTLKMREIYKTLPREVKDEILRTEGHYAKEISLRDRRLAELDKHAKEIGERHQEFADALAPYTAHLQSVGVAPAQAVKILFQNEYALRTGHEPQRAEVIASLMHGYNTTPAAVAAAWEALANGGGRPVAPAPQQPKPESFRDPEFAAFKAAAQQALQERKQAEVAANLAEIEAFKPQAEFWDDVKVELRAEWAAAKAAGERPTVQELYERACQRNKNVRTVLAERDAEAKAEKAKAEKVAALQQQTQRAQQARAAGSSVQSEPSAPAGGKRPSLDDAIAGIVRRHAGGR